MHLEYGQGRHTTEQFAVEFLTAKQARYSVKQFAAVAFIIATQFHPSTICFTVLAPGTAKHAWYIIVQYQLVGSCCFCLCKPVHVWVVNAQNAQNNQGTVPK